MLVYPAYLAKTAGKLAEELTINAKTPPIFIVHAEDDKAFAAGSKVFHAALDEAKIPNEFFLCATGGHGHGLRSKQEVSVWPKKCQEWLVKIGVMPNP